MSVLQARKQNKSLRSMIINKSNPYHIKTGWKEKDRRKKGN